MSQLPARAGVGLKLQHLPEIMDGAQHSDCFAPGFFEVHAENFMGAGGPAHAALTAIRARFPLSVHGVGLSIGGTQPLDGAHLARVKQVCDRYQPDSFSEHLAWSTHDTQAFHDLLPLPYTNDTLRQVCAHVDQVQTVLGRRMLLENPSSYLHFDQSNWAEVDFLAEVTRRTGCGLLLDVNNVFVSAVNLGQSATEYLAAFPLAAVGEIHLAGHAVDADDHGAPLLIDAHDRAVADAVWALYAQVIARIGPLPTLIEWDNDVPAWRVLSAEAARADALLRGEVAHAA